MDENKYLSVTQLTKYIKAKFMRDPYLEKIFVTGEISNFRHRTNGHQYFSLKDDQALIHTVMFKGNFSQLKFLPEEGMQVLITGHIGLYEKNGSYQLYVDEMMPDGVGALYLAYEQLKEKLTKEDLFDQPKQPIPRFPRKIAIVTSQSGAVIRDIITTVKRRYPIVQLVLYPTVVQGDKAKDAIVRNLDRIKAEGSYDTVIIGRGGGSIEELWPFNEEVVVREVAAMPIPVISSVGHETDTTLVDFVSDQRAATPTAAAELATPVLAEEKLRIKQWRQQLVKRQELQLKHARERLDQLKQTYFFKDPKRLYEVRHLQLSQATQQLTEEFQQLVSEQQKYYDRLERRLQQQSPVHHVQLLQEKYKQLHRQLIQNQYHVMENKRNAIQKQAVQLDALSPLKRLTGGYGYIQSGNQPINRVDDVTIGDAIQIQLQDGKIYANITGTRKTRY